MKKFFLIPLILLVTSCSLSEGLEDAGNAVAAFHEQMETGRYQEIYRNSSQGLKNATTEKDLTSLLNSFQTILGDVVSSSRTNFSFRTSTTTGNTYTVVYNTRYENGAGTETFVFVEEEGVLRLLSYNLNSNDYIRMLRERAEV